MSLKNAEFGGALKSRKINQFSRVRIRVENIETHFRSPRNKKNFVPGIGDGLKIKISSKSPFS